MTPRAIFVRLAIQEIIRRIWCSLRCAKAQATGSWANQQLRWNVKAKKNPSKKAKDSPEDLTVQQKVRREVIAWFWVALVFLLINGAVGQARVIPSESMKNTLLIGDHLIMSRLGFDAGIPF